MITRPAAVVQPGVVHSPAAFMQAAADAHYWVPPALHAADVISSAVLQPAVHTATQAIQPLSLGCGFREHRLVVVWVDDSFALCLGEHGRPLRHLLRNTAAEKSAFFWSVECASGMR